MTQIGLEDRVRFIGDIKQQLRVILLNILATSYTLSTQYDFSVKEVILLSKNFGTVASWGLAGPLRSLTSTRRWCSISLHELLDEIRERWEGKALPEGGLDVNDRLVDLDIWENRNGMGWLVPIESLLSWWSVGFAQLASVRWKSDASHIKVILTGAGKDLEVVKVKGKKINRWSFWNVKGGSPKAAWTSADALAAELLFAQLMAQQSGGSLAVEVGEEQISMVLSIPRAKISLTELEAILLPVDVAKDILLNCVACMMVSGWLSTGTRLLEALAREIAQLEVSAEGKVIEQVERLQEDRGKLALLLQTLEDEMVRWKTG
jgi:hypothetical protein